MTVHTLTSDNIFTEGLNWGISYDLPNESNPDIRKLLELRKNRLNKVNYPYNSEKEDHERPPYYADMEADTSYSKNKKIPNHQSKYRTSIYNYYNRRNRRELYHKLEVIMNAMGFDGRSCILKALCEASQRFLPKGNTLLEEIIRIIFSLPIEGTLNLIEPKEHYLYTEAHRAGHNGANCQSLFQQCSFSLVDLALGKYGDTSRDHDINNSEFDSTLRTEQIFNYMNMK